MFARKLRNALALALAGLLLFVGTASGQGGPRPQRATIDPAFSPPAQPAAPAAAPAQELTERTYLPMLRDASLSVVFGSSTDPETGAITDPGTTFPAGIQLLYVNTLFVGYQGNRYRTDAIFPDGGRETGPTTTATQAVEGERYALCITTTASCSSGTLPLSAGVYTIEVFINDQLVRSYQATLQ